MNAYYEPGKLGLSVVATADQENMSWEFDTFVVWKHNDGRIFCASDSGCSCPTPFEDYTTLESLTKIDSLSQLKYEVENWAGEQDECRRPGKDLLQACESLFKNGG